MNDQKKTMFKDLLVFDLTLIVCLNVWMLTQSFGHVMPHMIAVFCIVSAAFAAVYCLKGFSKAAAGVFKGYMYFNAVLYLGNICATAINIAPNVPSAAISQIIAANALVFAFYLIIAVSADLGEKQSKILSWVIAAITLVLMLLSVVGLPGVLRNGSMEATLLIIRAASKFTISMATVVMVYAKYADKAARGTK